VPLKKKWRWRRRRSRMKKKNKKFINNKQVRKRRHVTQYFMKEHNRHFRAMW